jgi:GR25 family glycosyltransferase involved in LPS biosynthesis
MIGNNGENIIDNIYYTTGISWQTHAYVINNKNINKIIEKTKYIDNLIDVKIFKNGNKKELNVIRLYPEIVLQGAHGTTIR